jgi:hypothetical protein
MAFLLSRPFISPLSLFTFSPSLFFLSLLIPSFLSLPSLCFFLFTSSSFFRNHSTSSLSLPVPVFLSLSSLSFPPAPFLPQHPFPSYSVLFSPSLISFFPLTFFLSLTYLSFFLYHLPFFLSLSPFFPFPSPSCFFSLEPSNFFNSLILFQPTFFNFLLSPSFFRYAAPNQRS